MNKNKFCKFILLLFFTILFSSCSFVRYYFDKSLYLFPSDKKNLFKNKLQDECLFLTVELDSSEKQNVRFSITGKMRKPFYYTDVEVHEGKNYLSLNTYKWRAGINSNQNPGGFKIESLHKVNVLSADITNGNRSDFYLTDNSFSKPYLTIFYDDEYYSQGENGNQNKVEMSVIHTDDNKVTLSKEVFTLRNSPRQTQVDFAYGAFSDDTALKNGKTSVEFSYNADKIKYISLHESHVKKENASSIEKFIPVTADPGLIPRWKKNAWRNYDYEIFSWQQIPQVYIFDFRNYAIQDKYLKRLAFFVEKSDYAGRIVTFEEVKDIHGFNAHDYRAESLASFFNQAAREKVRLAKEEEHLLNLLLELKVLVRSEDGVLIAGQGAIISISQESPDYLRNSLLSHEGFHGIYFTDPAFRRCVSDCFEKVDSGEKLFLLRYFDVTPSLKYNMNDSYLIQNEFMGYIMQQSVKNCRNYFAENLTSRYYINQYESQLVSYMKERQAQSILEQAKIMDDFVFTGYGLNAGRIFLVLRHQD